MSEDLQRLEEWVGLLIARLQPAQRRQLIRKIGLELRREHAKLIARQVAPDGTPFVPRKHRKALRTKSGRIKRQKAAMFNKLRTNSYLKVQADANQVSVGFFGKVARVARVHQEGLQDRVAPHGSNCKYATRPLLGFNTSDEFLLKESILQYLYHRI